MVQSLTLVLRQAQHEDERNQRVDPTLSFLILSLSKDEVARAIEPFSAAC
jgi:hypothetical protein